MTNGAKTHTVIFTESDAGQRLDKALAEQLPALSRSRIQQLLAEGCIHTAAGTALESANHKVKSGEKILVHIPEVKPTHIAAQTIALDIIHEDKDLLIINKPAGMTVHPAPGNHENTLVNALLAHCGASLSGIGGVARPGIVHRIDKDTSGLLVVAKHDAAHQHLSAQLQARTLKRTYIALCWGALLPKRGTITGNIGRSHANRQKMAVLKSGGKEAMTHYEVVETLGENLLSLLRLQLETGRTHQIRVHLTHKGHPLLGDPSYGAPTTHNLGSKQKHLPPELVEALLGFKRQALHAHQLEMIHPRSEKLMQFEAPLPEDMEMILEVLKA